MKPNLHDERIIHSERDMGMSPGVRTRLAGRMQRQQCGAQLVVKRDGAPAALSLAGAIRPEAMGWRRRGTLVVPPANHDRALSLARLSRRANRSKLKAVPLSKKQ
jgi:hypothetical protein